MGYLSWDTCHGILVMGYLSWDTCHGILVMGYLSWDTCHWTLVNGILFHGMHEPWDYWHAIAVLVMGW
jgi:hypothetical protein